MNYYVDDIVVNKFRESEEFARITDDPNVLMVYLGGSRCTGIIDDNSDYDFIVLYDKFPDCNTSLMVNSFFKVTGMHAHCYMDAVDSMFSVSGWGRALAFVHMSFIENTVLYVNPSRKKQVDWLLGCSNQFRMLGIFTLFSLYKPMVDDIVSSREVPIKYLRKILYHLYYCGCLICGKDYDKDTANRIKRGNRNGLSVDDKREIIRVLSDAKNIIDSSNFDAASTWDNIVSVYKLLIK